MTWATKRREPYTEVGIRRLRCMRCSNKAEFQWQICADGNNYRRLCRECDVALNRLVLAWMLHPKADELIDKYAAAKLGTTS